MGLFEAVASRRLEDRQQAPISFERSAGSRERVDNGVRAPGGVRADDAVRRENAAILFADIVGFTCLAEALAPEQTIDLLRRYHRRMGAQVFLHGGAVAQYSGDSIMAVFGAPLPGSHRASNALCCALGMLDAIATWNGKRRARGRPPIGIGIGLHFGPVGIGQVGVERHMEQAVVGDTVNVARKLEALTRKIGCALVVSAEFVGAARGEGRCPWNIARLSARGPALIAGRASAISIWALARQAV